MAADYERQVALMVSTNGAAESAAPPSLNQFFEPVCAIAAEQ
jgi:hypothetical protein